jgi:predicted metal-dependent hydrolase
MMEHMKRMTFSQSESAGIQYVYKHNKRSKRIRLVIYPGGQVVVTTPGGVAKDSINRFIASKSKWILGKLEQLKKFPVQSPAVRAKEYQEHKAKALEIAKDRIAHFNAFYGFPHGKVTIKNHKTMWGSCSRHGNLNFNYKIALIAQRFSDYVIVHELCHLKEFNHSKKFWDLVAQAIPDHKAVRKELQRLGLSLS